MPGTRYRDKDFRSKEIAFRDINAADTVFLAEHLYEKISTRFTIFVRSLSAGTKVQNRIFDVLRITWKKTLFS